jgi:membrane protein DedA with SNARE-associated domain
MPEINGLFSDILYSLNHLGVWAYWIIFLVAFADSLIIVGTFTTGTAFLLLAGVLVSQGVYDYADMAIFASVGAILGGLTSYAFGRFWSELLFVKQHKDAKQKHIERAANLIDRFDGAGILLGRFFGPISSITAFFAGLSLMRARTFILWNALAGLVWGAGYVTVGMLLGESFVFLHLFGL